MIKNKAIKELKETFDINTIYAHRVFSLSDKSKLIDISLNTIERLQLEESPNPTIETLQKNAKSLDVKVDDLIK